MEDFKLIECQGDTGEEEDLEMSFSLYSSVPRSPPEVSSVTSLLEDTEARSELAKDLLLVRENANAGIPLLELNAVVRWIVAESSMVADLTFILVLGNDFWFSQDHTIKILFMTDGCRPNRERRNC